MKNKYIDADLLRKDIDNWKEAMADAVGEYSDGVRFALEHFTFVLDSLQQEQLEVDIEKEFDDYIENVRAWEKDDKVIEYNNGDSFNHSYDIFPIARHFYELGIKAGKEENK